MNILPFAAHDPSYQSGLQFMRVGTVVMALGLLGVGLAVTFSKSKSKPETPGMRTARLILGTLIILAAIILERWHEHFGH
jgi:hypothetical protein